MHQMPIYTYYGTWRILYALFNHKDAGKAHFFFEKELNSKVKVECIHYKFL